MSKTAMHTFAVCAYKESPFLAECIGSVCEQTEKTRVIVCTATPNPHIEELAKQRELPLFVNNAEPHIAGDWNFAIRSAGTPFVTIAHQDDIYCPSYAAHALEALSTSDNPLLFFTNYGEIRDQTRVESNRLLATKRSLLKPLTNRANASNVRVRRWILSLGSAICCPSVTLAVENLPEPIFRTGLKSNLDWEAWERVSRLEGDFLYDPEILMYHRIHRGSETSALIKDNTRDQEDLEMLKRFWPTPIARLINVLYSRAQQSND